MVRTGNVDFCCKRLTSIEIPKSKYHIIRRVRFRWEPPMRKISGSALVTVLVFRPGVPCSNPVQILYFCHAFIHSSFYGLRS